MLTLSQTTISEVTLGRITNLASNDVHHFDYVSRLLDIIFNIFRHFGPGIISG